MPRSARTPGIPTAGPDLRAEFLRLLDELQWQDADVAKRAAISEDGIQEIRNSAALPNPRDLSKLAALVSAEPRRLEFVRILEEAKLTDSQAAELLGVKRTYVNMIRRKRAIPSETLVEFLKLRVQHARRDEANLNAMLQQPGDALDLRTATLFQRIRSLPARKRKPVLDFLDKIMA